MYLCMCALLPDSLIRRSDAILVLTSGLKREVAAGKGLEPVACAPCVCSVPVSGVRSVPTSCTLSNRASLPVRVFVCVFAGCVSRLAPSEGGCNTLDPRFIFLCVFVCVCKRRGNQNSEERRAREMEEEEEEKEEGSLAKIR